MKRRHPAKSPQSRAQTADHLLRLIDRHIPFDFIREATAHVYCVDNGCPTGDPVQLVKMLFIGYLFDDKIKPRLRKKTGFVSSLDNRLRR
jgi:transposase